eukprot:2409563-Ditylum_brightwellii.AAC.1
MSQNSLRPRTKLFAVQGTAWSQWFMHLPYISSFLFLPLVFPVDIIAACVCRSKAVRPRIASTRCEVLYLEVAMLRAASWQG